MLDNKCCLMWFPLIWNATEFSIFNNDCAHVEVSCLQWASLWSSLRSHLGAIDKWLRCTKGFLTDAIPILRFELRLMYRGQVGISSLIKFYITLWRKTYDWAVDSFDNRRLIHTVIEIVVEAFLTNFVSFRRDIHFYVVFARSEIILQCIIGITKPNRLLFSFPAVRSSSLWLLWFLGWLRH